MRKLRVFLLVIAFLLFNLVLLNSLLVLNPLQKSLLNTGRWLYSPGKHLSLAKTLYENGYEQMAVEEFTIAKKLPLVNFFYKKQVREVEQMLQQKQAIISSINQYLKIIANKPYYKDVFIKLALAYYQINDQQNALNYYKEAFYLDPNNPLIARLETIIK